MSEDSVPEYNVVGVDVGIGDSQSAVQLIAGEMTDDTWYSVISTLYDRHSHLFERLAEHDGPAEQLTLPFTADELLPIVPTSRKGGLQVAFESFHRNNPHIFTLLRRMALRIRRKNKKMGIKALWEQLRYAYTVEVDSDDGYKLNNNHHSFYAQLIMDTTPELEGFFETRKEPVEWIDIDLEELML